jgi:hypothetical protein
MQQTSSGLRGLNVQRPGTAASVRGQPIIGGGICRGIFGRRNDEMPGICGLFIMNAVPTRGASIFNKFEPPLAISSPRDSTRLKGNPAREAASTDRLSLRAPLALEAATEAGSAPRRWGYQTCENQSLCAAARNDEQCHGASRRSGVQFEKCHRGCSQRSSESSSST